MRKPNEFQNALDVVEHGKKEFRSYRIDCEVVSEQSSKKARLSMALFTARANFQSTNTPILQGKLREAG